MTCPSITAEANRHFKQAMKTYLSCFQSSGKSCQGDANGLVDDLKNGCEIAFIGHDYTWHTHPCGGGPSQEDVNTTMKLNRRYLCIGQASKGITECYDLQEKGKKTNCVF